MSSSQEKDQLTLHMDETLKRAHCPKPGLSEQEGSHWSSSRFNCRLTFYWDMLSPSIGRSGWEAAEDHCDTKD